MRRASHLALAALLVATLAQLQASPASAAASGDARAADETGARRVPAAPLSAEGRYIVSLKAGKDVDTAEGRAHRLGVRTDRTYRRAMRGYAAQLTPDQVAALRTDPDVEFVVPDEIITLTAQTRPTGVRRVHGPESAIARINGTDGDVQSGERVDADVAIVDTGIDASHPDLNVVGGISCSTDNPNAWGSDPNGHGTHVAGIVGAKDNTIGVVGVAPGVRLWSVRILDSSGSGLLSWYVCGLDWIASQRDPVDPSRPLIEAVNMSVAKEGKDDQNCGYTNADVMHKAVCRVVAAGITVVAAAGNNHYSASNLKPASYDEVITVSALADTDGKSGGTGGDLCYSWGGYDQDDTFADFSNFGSDVDLIAPGKCIYSTLPGNRYGYISGTSMAAPHVTGAAALYKASRPLATPAQVRTALRAAGTLDWKTGTDPDTIHEPLLDVSHILALGDWTFDATPGASSGALVGAAGATMRVPVALVAAEDYAGSVDLSLDGGAPFGAHLDSTRLVGGSALTTNLTFTVPAGTGSGTYSIGVTATDGTVDHASSFPIRVDSVAPAISTPAMRLRSGTQLTPSAVAATGVWPAGTDPGGAIGAYQLRWRIDGSLKDPFGASSAARTTNRTMSIGSSYTLRVRAQDQAGNWSDWKESSPFAPELWQDTSSTLTRKGGWTFERRTFLSGGSALHSTHKGATLTRTFNGRAVGVVMSKGPGRGMAAIFVDGVHIGNVNTHRSTASYRWLVYARSWPTSGPHRVSVVVLGTRGHPRIDVDTFVIVP